MKRFSEQFYKKSQAIKLTVAERDDLKERLVSYIEYHPMPGARQERVLETALATEAFAWVSIPYRLILKIAVPAAVLLLVIIPFVAEKAVPGDALYAVKQVNEDFRSTLIFDSYQRIEWETERINRRIAEARLLASEGKLTEAVEVEVALAVKEHTDVAMRQIEELRIEDADEAEIASIALDTTLEVQSTSLKEEAEGSMEIDPNTGESQPHISLIATTIDASLEQSAEGELSALPAYDKLMARVELNTTRVYELRNSLVNVVSAESLSEVDRRVADVERSVQSAIELSSATNTVAQEQLVDVLQRTQKLIVYMTELEVTYTVDIEDIVPVVMTGEEEVVSKEVLAAEILHKANQIQTSALEIEDEAVSGKVEFALAEITRLTEMMASGTVAYADFEIWAIEANTLADDTLKLLEQAGELVGLPLETTLEDVSASGTEALPLPGVEGISTGTDSVNTLGEDAELGIVETNDSLLDE